MIIRPVTIAVNPFKKMQYKAPSFLKFVHFSHFLRACHQAPKNRAHLAPIQPVQTWYQMNPSSLESTPGHSQMLKHTTTLFSYFLCLTMTF